MYVHSETAFRNVNKRFLKYAYKSLRIIANKLTFRSNLTHCVLSFILSASRAPYATLLENLCRTWHNFVSIWQNMDVLNGDTSIALVLQHKINALYNRLKWV